MGNAAGLIERHCKDQEMLYKIYPDQDIEIWKLNSLKQLRIRYNYKNNIFTGNSDFDK